MPFRSEAQRRFLYSQHPEIAKEFEAATPKGKRLPEKVGKKKPTHNQEDEVELRTNIRGVVCTINGVVSHDFDKRAASEEANHATGRANEASTRAAKAGSPGSLPVQHSYAVKAHKEAAQLHSAAAAAHGKETDAGRYHKSMGFSHLRRAVEHQKQFRMHRQDSIRESAIRMGYYKK